MGFDLDSKPGSASAAVTRAHIHPAPLAHLPIPERGGNRDAASPLPGETPAQASPPQQVPQQPPEASADCPPPPPEVVPVPSTPPPSPETQHPRAASRSPPPQAEDSSHQEPEENTETEDSAVIPEHLSSVDAAPPSSLVERSEPETQTPRAEVLPPTRPPAAQLDSDMTHGSSLSVKTPEKAPVQDSTPPILQKERTPVPACTQVSAYWLNF